MMNKEHKEKTNPQIDGYVLCGEQVRDAIKHDCGIFFFQDDHEKLVEQAYEQGKRGGRREVLIEILDKLKE